jgi:predicted ATPase/transcriptional regulator with XRE-family HTH domain
MKRGAFGSFGTQLKALREAAGFTQEELATIAGLSVHAVSALERGERRRPHVETVRALSAALDLSGAAREALAASARPQSHEATLRESGSVPLPLAPTRFLGRELDVQTLRQWLSDRTARLVTLIGPGGVGKTRLALELARSIATEDTYRVVFVPLAGIRSPAFVASAIAERLGFSDTTPLDLPRRARLACADQPTVLVLDNFEQVLDAAPMIADLLTSVASLRVLATSRAPLRVRGEREYVVDPLALDVDQDAVAPADVSGASAAVQLFVERVRDVQPGFHLTRGNSATVTSICRRLDALPLALELAAPWMKVLGADDLLGRLGQDLLLSSLSPRDLPERQQTMNATVAWSYQLLAPHEQRVFRRLGALPGRFPIEAAEAVVGGRNQVGGTSNATLVVAAALIDKSLLLRDDTSVPDRPLYRMLETVRAYAALELAKTGEADDACDGLVRYCTGEAALAGEGLLGQAQVEWFDRVHNDLENYRHALAWLIERNRSAEAAHIASSLWFFWAIRGHATEGLEWCEQILRLPGLSPATESRLIVGSGPMWYTQGNLDRARTRVTRGLELAQGAGETSTAAFAESLLGHVELAFGNLHPARAWFIRSIDGFRALAIPWGLSNGLSGAAWVALANGEVGLAERLLDEAALVLRHAGPWWAGLPLYLRAVLAVRRGKARDAIRLVGESLTHIRALNDKFALVYALVPLAAAAVLSGDDAWAARIVGVRDTVTERTGATVVDRSVEDLRDQAEREVRARLGPDRWARAYATGRVSSIDSLLKDIDRIMKKETDS